jgi:diguanylate cyclase (GGDEF)-like protein/PAS domain S-box-containing protein
VSNARILIVEDERIVAADLAAVLRQLGYVVTGTAASAQQALTLVAADPPDLVLMDIHIRGEVDGVALAAALREQHALPVIFVSAFADDATITRARRTQPYGYLVKPFNDRELKGAIEIALHHHEMEQRLEAILGNIEDGVALLSAERAVVFANGAYCRLFGLEPERITGMSRDAFLAHLTRCLRDPERDLPRLASLSSQQGATQSSFELRWPTRRILRRTVKPVRVTGAPGFLVVWHDETSNVDLIAEREHRANTDALTGVGNRRAGDTSIAAAIARGSHDGGHPHAIVLFDIDHFKQVNDVHGHATGDDVLRLVAQVLQAEARGHDTIARWGGEEFIAVLPTTVDGAIAFSERVRTLVEELTTPAGAITLSAGVAAIAPGDDLAAVLARADGALYQAKHGGRNRVVATR